MMSITKNKKKPIKKIKKIKRIQFDKFLLKESNNTHTQRLQISCPEVRQKFANFVKYKNKRKEVFIIIFNFSQKYLTKSPTGCLAATSLYPSHQPNQKGKTYFSKGRSID